VSTIVNAVVELDLVRDVIDILRVEGPLGPSDDRD
jgi:hypothetical protein